MDRVDGATALFIDGVEAGALTDGWLERVLERPTPFERRDGAVHLVAELPTYTGHCAALARWADDARARWGRTGWRDERVVVRDERDGRPLASIERALLRPLGLVLRSVSACAWTDTEAGTRLWIARRAWHKPIDPGCWDALVAGGIAGFDDARSTLERECAEEAGIPAALARRATPAGSIELCYPTVDDGLPVLHREQVALYELRLPSDFAPCCVDGEHAEIVGMSPLEALSSIAQGGWTRDGAQATTDLVLRHGWMPDRGESGGAGRSVTPDRRPAPIAPRAVR